MKPEEEIQRLKAALKASEAVQMELDRNVFHLRTLYDVSRDIYHSIEPDKIIRNFLLMAMGNFGSKRGFVALSSASSKKIEPQQRAHSPWVLPFGSASHAAGLASESKLDRIPYGRCEALPHGRTFPAACGGELQYFESLGYLDAEQTALVGAAKFDSYTGSRWTYTARGGAVNLAARIGKLATGGRILVSRQTSKRLTGRYQTDSLGLFELKNISREVEIFQLAQN